MDGLAQLGRIALTLGAAFVAVWFWVFLWLALFAVAHYTEQALDRMFTKRAHEELDRYWIIE